MVSRAIQVRTPSLAVAYHAEGDALADDDPWVRSAAQAEVWLRSPGFTDGTRDQYRRIWASWWAWCQRLDVAPLHADRRALEGYTTALERVGNPAARQKRPLSRRSIARHMAALSSFYKRAIEDEATDRNPVPPSGRPQVSRKSKQPYLTPDELRALLAAADADSPRMSGLVALLLLGCLRVSEALSARVEDIRPAPGGRELHTIGKGDKEKTTPLPAPLWQRIAPLVAGRRHGTIVTTRNGTPLDRSNAWREIRRLAAAAGIAQPVGPHTLRHAFITRGFELELPTDHLRQTAGHESDDTTRGYNRAALPLDRHPVVLVAADLAAGP